MVVIKTHTKPINWICAWVILKAWTWCSPRECFQEQLIWINCSGFTWRGEDWRVFHYFISGILRDTCTFCDCLFLLCFYCTSAHGKPLLFFFQSKWYLRSRCIAMKLHSMYAATEKSCMQKWNSVSAICMFSLLDCSAIHKAIFWSCPCQTSVIAFSTKHISAGIGVHF